MKQLLITIAALVLVGCGPSVPDISIHNATEKGNIEAVKQHLAAGTDVNTKNSIGMTPLHVAASDSHKEIADLLIAGGANVNGKTSRGSTPLEMAFTSMRGPAAVNEMHDLLPKHGGKKGV